jgi:hypothetical protein
VQRVFRACVYARAFCVCILQGADEVNEEAFLATASTT